MVVWACGQDAPRMSPIGSVSDMPLGQTLIMLERLYFSSVVGRPRHPPRGAGFKAGERIVWACLLTQMYRRHKMSVVPVLLLPSPTSLKEGKCH